MVAPHGLVILIHGLWMNGLELTLLRWRLRAAGFRTKRFHYPTMRASLEDNARRFAAFIENIPEHPLYIVAHSLGGLVTLRAFERQPDLPVERVVFMAAPVRGSSVARALSARPWGERLLGKSGRGGLAAVYEPEWRYAPSCGMRRHWVCWRVPGLWAWAGSKPPSTAQMTGRSRSRKRICPAPPTA